MNALLTGIESYITSWQTPLAIVVVAIAAYMWMSGHRAAAALEVLGGMAVLYTATSVATQFGF